MLTFFFFSLLKKFLLRGPGLKHGCILVCAHVADGPELSVSKKVEAVGHSVTPCRRNTPRQEKTFSIRSLFLHLISSFGGHIFSVSGAI